MFGGSSALMGILATFVVPKLVKELGILKVSQARASYAMHPSRKKEHDIVFDRSSSETECCRPYYLPFHRDSYCSTQNFLETKQALYVYCLAQKLCCYQKQKLQSCNSRCIIHLSYRQKLTKMPFDIYINYPFESAAATGSAVLHPHPRQQRALLPAALPALSSPSRCAGPSRQASSAVHK